MKRFIPFILLLVCQLVSYSQVGIGTDAPSPRSILDLHSNNKGFLMPRMTATERTTMLQPTLTQQDVGMMVFQTSPFKGLFVYQGFISNQHKWSCLPVVNDTDPQGSTLRWDGTAWVNTVDLYFTNSNKIGFFTTNPKSELHLHGTAVNTQLQITEFSTGTTENDGLALGVVYQGNAYLNQRENKPLTFSTNNIERVKIDSDGDVGINQPNPQAKLDVNGTFKLGSSGAVLTNILRQAIQVDIPMCDSMTSVAMPCPFPNAVESATVHVSPAAPMGNFMIAYSRVSAAGFVEIKFMNMGDDSDPAPMTFYVTVIQ